MTSCKDSGETRTAKIRSSRRRCGIRLKGWPNMGTVSATMKLAKVLDEFDIGQSPAECLLMVLPSRRKLVTRRDELRPVQGGTEDTAERVMTSRTELRTHFRGGRT